MNTPDREEPMSKPGMTDEECDRLAADVLVKHGSLRNGREGFDRSLIRAAYDLGRKAQRKRDAALIRCVGAAAIEGAEDE